MSLAEFADEDLKLVLSGGSIFLLKGSTIHQYSGQETRIILIMSLLPTQLIKYKPPWKTVWNFLRKLKMELPFDPAMPLLGLYLRNPETPIQKNLCTPMFIAAQFIIAECWKQPRCPSANEWIKNPWYSNTMEFYAAERKKELLPFATAWMELESIMLSEISQVVRDKHHMISPLTGT